MRVSDRRAFLASLGGAGAFAVAGSWLPIGDAQAGPGPARVFLRRSPGRGDFDRRLLGSFLEHLGRAIYSGVYEPESRLADAKGFRTDVAREVKDLGVPILRYPGGNFVSGYNWLDGVGPKAQRPVVLDRAWNSLETNQFGTNEFLEWCGMVGTEPLLGMNFGTGTVEMAVAYVETLLRNSDRVRLACLAQLLNVIAPLVTNETGVLRQSTDYPYSWALRYGRGRVLDLRVESETYRISADGLQADFARDASVPFLDIVATIDDATGQAAVLALNRDLDGEREVVIQWEDVVPTRVLACETLTGPDLKSVNTFADPRRVVPPRLEPPAVGSRMTFKLPSRSYTVAHVATRA